MSKKKGPHHLQIEIDEQKKKKKRSSPPASNQIDYGCGVL